ncbi:MAG: ATPase [Ignavibacteriae bacterium HGW-Ignavibacteriae-4]|jgi:hypothetical protein|nr:MAG: ATPase [Ignavibacteriae bacterium HGW-Ignavibacteriae-4]
MNKKKILITKMSGEKDEFDESKLMGSLERSGADDETIFYIIKNIKSLLFDGISTKEIYKKAFELLRKSSRPTAAKYKLKKAILELGPTGYPFERFIGEVLKYEGFDVEVGIIVDGHCVTHEIDVIAEKYNKHYIVECKFHSDQARKCDVKVPLYIKSRFDDVEKERRKNPKNNGKIHKGWIYTNTRFTSDAIQYGNCSGLGLVSWDSPHGSSLRERIDRAGLHPITCLTTLNSREKQMIIEKDIVLCMHLNENPDLLNIVGIKRSKHKSILKESMELCRK